MLAMMPRTLHTPAVPDADLIRRFVSARDEAAFELLVWRYRGLVADVCSRALGHAHDAEDASQAAFFILARKAGVVKGEAVAPVSVMNPLPPRSRAVSCDSREQPASTPTSASRSLTWDIRRVRTVGRSKCSTRAWIGPPK
jgi:hypothetical protein